MMMNVSDTIKNLVENIPGAIYLRATDFEANISLDDIDLEGKTVYIYNNLPIINYDIETAIIPQWPIVIRLMQLSDLDGNTLDKDVIRESLVKPAQAFLEALLNDPISSQATLPTSATITFLGDNYDKHVTGVELGFDLQLNYFC